MFCCDFLIRDINSVSVGVKPATLRVTEQPTELARS